MQDGVAPGGVMDLHAHAWANQLLGKPIQQPSIEITLGLFGLEVLTDCVVAITGADLRAQLNSQSIEPWRTYYLKQGDRLDFNQPRKGFRAYLAVSADIDMPLNYGSLSTVPREHESGLVTPGLLTKGRVLNARGIQVPNTSAPLSAPSFVPAFVPDKYIPDYQADLELELLPCYQFEQFDNDYLDGFFGSSFKIASQSNRMAYLLQGSDPKALQHKLDVLPSAANSYGAVQIPPSGDPVVLLNDRQTIGGYAKLGAITRLSGSQLSQRFAPSMLSFKPISIEMAQQKMAQFNAFFRA